MSIDSKNIPPNIIARMTDEQKMQFGLLATHDTGGGVPSGEEDKLQADIRCWLTANSVEFINPPMWKRSELPEHWPDFTFVHACKPFGIEAKTAKGKLSKGQVQKHVSMRANGWNVHVVRSFPEFLEVISG